MKNKIIYTAPYKKKRKFLAGKRKDVFLNFPAISKNTNENVSTLMKS
jgi:hypothetical protein